MKKSNTASTIYDPSYEKKELFFGSRPQLWIIISIELYLRYEGDVFSLLVHPFYSSNEIPEDYSDGFLYPPFYAVQLDSDSAGGQYGPKTVGEWKELTNKFMDTNEIPGQRRMDEILNLYGIGAVVTDHRSSVWEEKTSPVSGYGTNLYRVERYICRPRQKIQRKNITDPHFMKGHIFVPILRKADSDFPSLGQMDLFKGRRIVSNYLTAIQNDDELDEIRSLAWETCREDWVTKHKGFLVMIDIAGFGSLSEHIKSSMGTIYEDGESIANKFRNGVAEVFERVLHVSDPIQSYFTGDGMIASLPERVGPQAACTCGPLQTFLASYQNCIRYLDKLNALVPDTAYHVGTRLVIHYGEFEYGRVGGPSSNASNFGGDAIVELARSEGGLSQISKSDDSDLGRHCIAFTTAALSALGSVNLTVDHFAKFTENHEVKVKERTIRLTVGELNLEQEND